MSDYNFEHWAPSNPWAHFVVFGAILALLVVGTAINLIGLVALRRAFTIMTEARVFVRTGIYRFIRHPLYAAHFVINFGFVLLHFHAYTVAIFCALVAGQTLRAKIEEGKMTASFPEYEEYRRATGMFLPRMIRSS